MTSTGGELAAARKSAGLTLAQLVSRVGVPQSQIARIEYSSGCTTIRTMRRITAALGGDRR